MLDFGPLTRQEKMSHVFDVGGVPYTVAVEENIFRLYRDEQSVWELPEPLPGGKILDLLTVAGLEQMPLFVVCTSEIVARFLINPPQPTLEKEAECIPRGFCFPEKLRLLDSVK